MCRRTWSSHEVWEAEDARHVPALSYEGLDVAELAQTFGAIEATKARVLGEGERGSVRHYTLHCMIHYTLHCIIHYTLTHCATHATLH